MESSSKSEAASPHCTAVIDIGKTSSRLLLIDEYGRTLHEAGRQSSSLSSGYGYQALDSEGCERWLLDALGGLDALRHRVRSIIVATHGAAVAGVQGDRLAFPVPDYESGAFSERATDLQVGLDDFAASQSPLLPLGLNMGVQLDWLRRHQPDLLDSAAQLMPYAQYWAWRLTGVATSEVSSLGCHTLLWNPAQRRYSHWAERQGFAAKFAPIRKAWDVAGVVKPALAHALRLPQDVQVHVGVHDSNACLARYLRAWPRVTLVSSGTWVVVMSTGGLSRNLNAKWDQLGNVSVRGDAVPTARFMGGREMTRLCAGAHPLQANPSMIAPLLARGLRITPGFERQGGAFALHDGTITLDGMRHSLDSWMHQVPADMRATAASIYMAQMTAWTIETLGGMSPIVVDGPLAHNPVAMTVLSALLPTAEVYVSTDTVEGTARGAWMLAHWTDTTSYEPQIERISCDAALAARLVEDRSEWVASLPRVSLAAV